MPSTGLHDKFGIPYIYPDADNAGVTGEGTRFFWEQNNDIFEDNDDGMVRLGKEQDDVDVISTSTGEWEFPFDSGADYFCMEVRQGHKSGGEEHGCEGSCYIFNVTLKDTPPKFYYQKQLYHGGSKFKDPNTGEFTHADVDEVVVGSGWKGFAAVVYGKKDGRAPGKDSAILEIWWNEDPVADIENWFMVKRTEDKGGWGSDGSSCDGDDDQVITWSNIQFRYKSGTPDFSLHPLIPEFEDGPVIHSIGGADMSFEDSENRGYGKRADMPANVEMKCLFKFDENDGICRLKNLSLREIDPLKSFDDDPQTPPEPGNTQTIQGKFTLKWDLNTSRTSTCAGTTESGSGYHYEPYGTFDGAGGGVINIADDPSLDLNQFSIALWFRTTDDNFPPEGEGMMVTKGGWLSDDPNKQLNYGLWHSDANNLRGGFENAAGDDYILTTSAGPDINDGQWHHAVVTHDGTNVRLYKDGAEIPESPLATGGDTPATSTNDLVIGDNSFPTTHLYYTGNLDQIYIWNNDLTSGEVAALYTAGTVPQTGNLVYSNTFGGSSGVGGTTKFYTKNVDTDKELSDTSTFDNRTRIVMKPSNSSSVFRGKTPKRVDIPLKRVGTPSSAQEVLIKIYNSSNQSLYTAITEIDPATLPTSFTNDRDTWTTFDLSDNNHMMVTGDRIGVVYGGLSSSNYVVTSYSGTATANTDYYQYEDGSYQLKSRSLVMDVWE